MMQKVLLIVAALVILTVLGVTLTRHRQSVVTTPAGTIRYLPLGDSYTIGESVSESERWPNQLVAALASGQPAKKLQIVTNPAVTGYTTQDLINRELPVLATARPDFVTVQIGVNDYVQGVDAATFKTNLNFIVAAVQKQLKQPSNLVLVTIPDFGKTPTGARFGSPASSEAGIKAFNQIIIAAAAEHKLTVADIFGVSQAVATDSSLIADDGLHPSGKEYAAWTQTILAAMRAADLPR